ncbi:MAG: acetyltransferase [Bacteroidetes bacterium]|nr:acetyltransferase [Bacteroidota bacterium]
MQKNKFYLWGASGHGMVIAEIIESAGDQVQGFLDADTSIKELLGYSVQHRIEDMNFDATDQWIISVGKNATRKKLAESNKLNYGKAIHPSAILSARCTIAEGTVVMAGVSINSKAQIGKHVILNTGCSVDHECIIEDYVHLSPHAVLPGNVIVGEGTHIGTGAVAIPGIKIGKWCTIGAGTVIIKDVPDGATVVGVPGRIVRL